MNFTVLAKSFLKHIKRYQHILIYIQGSPDPDAIGAAFLFREICEHYQVKGTIVCPEFPSLPQNIKLIKDLNIPIEFKHPPGNIKKYDAYAILDFQTVNIEGITGMIPCVLHIDHHQSGEQMPVDFKIIMEDIGSTCGIMTLLHSALKIRFKNRVWARVATALYYGIQTDTDNFKNAFPLDLEALNLIKPYADKLLLKKINNLPYPREVGNSLKRVLKKRIIYRDWLIAGIGFIPEEHRDIVAIIADLILKREDISTVVIFSIIEKTPGLFLQASFRTKDPKLDLNSFIKDLAKDGGARHFKGAFQVNLDFFIHAPDMKQLWEMVEASTIKALRSKIDELSEGKIKYFVKGLKDKIKSFFIKSK